MGAYVSYANFWPLGTRTPAEMQIEINGNAATPGLMHVEAINVPAPTAPVLQFLGSEPARIVPNWVDVFVNEPLIIMLTTFATLVGLLAVLPSRRKPPATG